MTVQRGNVMIQFYGSMYVLPVTGIKKCSRDQRFYYEKKKMHICKNNDFPAFHEYLKLEPDYMEEFVVPVVVSTMMPIEKQKEMIMSMKMNRK